MQMAYVEMVFLVLVSLTGLVLLALAVASGPVSHRSGTHAAARHFGGPPARPWSRSAPMTPGPGTPGTAGRRARGQLPASADAFGTVRGAGHEPVDPDRGRAVSPTD